jgi:hypothetical protein
MQGRICGRGCLGCSPGRGPVNTGTVKEGKGPDAQPTRSRSPYSPSRYLPVGRRSPSQKPLSPRRSLLAQTKAAVYPVPAVARPGPAAEPLRARRRSPSCCRYRSPSLGPAAASPSLAARPAGSRCLSGARRRSPRPSRRAVACPPSLAQLLPPPLAKSRSSRCPAQPLAARPSVRHRSPSLPSVLVLDTRVLSSFSSCSLYTGAQFMIHGCSMPASRVIIAYVVSTCRGTNFASCFYLQSARAFEQELP